MPQAVTSAIQESVREAEEYADDAVENGKKELAKQADIVALRQENARKPSRHKNNTGKKTPPKNGGFNIVSVDR